MRHQRLYHRFKPIAAVYLAAAVAGCSSSPETGHVKGKVTFQGKPVAEGMVTFLNLTEGGAAEARIKGDGTYEVRGVAPGEYRVVVNPLVEMVDTDPGKSPPAPVEKHAPDIPSKYRQQGSSTLNAAVKAGPNTFDFELKL